MEDLTKKHPLSQYCTVSTCQCQCMSPLTTLLSQLEKLEKLLLATESESGHEPRYLHCGCVHRSKRRRMACGSTGTVLKQWGPYLISSDL